MLKFTVSGTYRNAAGHDAERVEFDKLEVLMPDCDEDRYIQNLNRIVPGVIKANEKYPLRCEVLEQVFVDNVETVKGDDGLAGKDIKELSWDELQFLCIKHNLREIPYHGVVSLREAREKAYVAYMSHIRQRDLPIGEFKDWPPLLLDDSKHQAEEPEVLSNEQILQAERENDGSSNLTFEELKEAARLRGITFHHAIGYKKLYELVFGQ